MTKPTASMIDAQEYQPSPHGLLKISLSMSEKIHTTSPRRPSTIVLWLAEIRFVTVCPKALYAATQVKKRSIGTRIFGYAPTKMKASKSFSIPSKSNIGIMKHAVTRNPYIPSMQTTCAG